MVRSSPRRKSRRKSSKLRKSRRKSRLKSRRKSSPEVHSRKKSNLPQNSRVQFRRMKSINFNKKSQASGDWVRPNKSKRKSRSTLPPPFVSLNPYAALEPSSPLPPPPLTRCPPWALRQYFPPELAETIYFMKVAEELKSHSRYNDFIGGFSLIKRRRALAIIDDFNHQYYLYLSQGGDSFHFLIDIERSFARSNVNFRDPDNWGKPYWIAYMGCLILYDLHTNNRAENFVIDKLRILCAPHHNIFNGGGGIPYPTVSSSSSDIYNFLNQFTIAQLRCVGY